MRQEKTPHESPEPSQLLKGWSCHSAVPGTTGALSLSGCPSITAPVTHILKCSLSAPASSRRVNTFCAGPQHIPIFVFWTEQEVNKLTDSPLNQWKINRLL